MEGTRVKGSKPARTGGRAAASPVPERQELEAPFRKAKKVALPAYRLKFCKALVDHKVAEAMPLIADKFAREAIKGSIEYARALAELARVEKTEETPVKKKRHGLADILMEEFKRKKKKAEAGHGSARKAGGV